MYPKQNHDLAALIAAERPWVVRVCMALSGDPDMAEDLAQEVLIEALRLRERVYDPGGLRPWLRAVARNVCARWLRWRGCERARAHQLADNEEWTDDLADPWAIEVELERSELALLLDRALALLPEETRAVLVARYVEETPHGAIAQQLGVSEGAVAMRLQRGRLALKGVLGGALRHEAAAYGLVSGDEPLQQTGIWCPMCGQQRLGCWLDRESGVGRFFCPACVGGEQRHIAGWPDKELLATLRSPKAILSRQIAQLHQFYRGALARPTTPCLTCGRPCIVEGQLPPGPIKPVWGRHGLSICCPVCPPHPQTLHYLVLDLPEVQRFWRKHPRMRMAGEQKLDCGGRESALITFESLSDEARIEVVSALDTFEVLALDDPYL